MEKSPCTTESLRIPDTTALKQSTEKSDEVTENKNVLCSSKSLEQIKEESEHDNIESESATESDTSKPSIKAETGSSKLPQINFRRINFAHQLQPASLTLQVNILNVETEALLDTGARICLMKRSEAERLDVCVDSSNASEIYGIGGKQKPNRIQTHGTVNVALRITQIEFPTVQFHVVEDHHIDYPIFIGLDFLRKYKLTVNICKQRISHTDSKTGAKWDLYLFPENYRLIMSNILCRAVGNIKINANELPTTLIPVKLYYPSGYIPNLESENTLMYYDGDLALPAGNHLKGNAGILDLKKPTILVSALASCEIFIKSGEVMGKSHTVVYEDEIADAIEVNAVMPTKENPPQLDFATTLQNLSNDLTQDQKDQILKLFREQEEVMSTSDSDGGTIDAEKFKIRLYDETPVYHRPRRFPDPVSQEVERHCEGLIANGIIEPSKSPYNCRVLPIRKKDGSLRLCMDYRDLNSKTIPDRHPMPNITDSIYSLHGSKFFTTLDLVRGYYQLPVEEESRPYTAFSTSRGHWQYKRMPFGLRNAPAAFQRAMQQVLRDLPIDKVVIYLDDILIISKDFKEHLQLVRRVLKTLRSHGIKIKMEKCAWFQDKVEFLGHEISQEGLSKRSKYINEIREFPKPENVRELRQFLGLVNWQRKFIKNCAEIGKPLYRLTGGKRTRKLTWTPEMDSAFEQLKIALEQDIILAFPNFRGDAPPMELYVDASATGVGVCLCQQQDGERRVIAYDSYFFSDAQQKYSTIERELVAIRWGVKAFRPFLFGQPFILHTDHQPLVYLHNMKLVDNRLARTLEDLAEFEFTIKYTPGRANEAADAMSRKHHLHPESEFLPPDTILPEGIQIVMPAIPGGGDSLFAALVASYQTVNSEAAVMTSASLRKELVEDLLNNRKLFGLPSNKKFTKLLKSMRYPEVFPIQDVLVAFAERYKVTVFVHYGFGRPVVYRGKSEESPHRIHLQCLAGIHYNALTEMPVFKSSVVSDWCVPKDKIMTVCTVYNSSKENQLPAIYSVDEDPEEENGNGNIEQSTKVVKNPSCDHNLDGTVATVNIQDYTCCAMLDSGAFVNLMCERVFKKLPYQKFEDSNICYIRGIGLGSALVRGTTTQDLSLGSVTGATPVHIVQATF